MSSIKGSEVKKICLACEAGAGSSLMVKNSLIKKAKKAGLDVEIVHAPATQIPADADIVVCHTGLAGAARNAAEDKRKIEGSQGLRPRDHKKEVRIANK